MNKKRYPTSKEIQRWIDSSNTILENANWRGARDLVSDILDVYGDDPRIHPYVSRFEEYVKREGREQRSNEQDNLYDLLYLRGRGNPHRCRLCREDEVAC